MSKNRFLRALYDPNKKTEHPCPQCGFELEFTRLSTTSGDSSIFNGPTMTYCRLCERYRLHRFKRTQK